MKIRSLLIGMLAIIALVGCTNDDESPLANEEGKEVAVQFTLNLQGEVESRAISDGTGARQLMYAVFEKVNESEMRQVSDKKVVNDTNGNLIGNGYQLSIALLNGRTYQVVFWAQNASCTRYNVTNDMNVTINYEGANNDELRDAFFATEEITAGAQSTYNVTLKRPFAQVNVGAFQTDYNEAERLGIKVSQSSATFAKVPNVINLVNGNVSGEVDVTYSFGNIPAEALKRVDVDGDGYHELYKWVSMSYILASTDRTSHQMNFSFINEANPNDVIFFEKSASVQRNYRTNIVGQVLTNSNQFNIQIDPIYEDERSSIDKIYYVFDKPTIVEDEVFSLTKSEWGTWCVFTMPKGSQEDIMITFDNVKFSGQLYSVNFGEDWRDENHNRVQTNHQFTLNNVTAENVQVANCVTDGPNHVSPLFYLAGKTTVTNCTWIGTTTVNNDPIDEAGVQNYVGKNDLSDNRAYDCGVRPSSNVSFDNCTMDAMYVWQDGKATLTNSHIKYLRSGALYYTPKINGMLTIDEGTTIDVLEIAHNQILTNFKLALTIKEGAKVKELRLNGRSLDSKHVSIAEGTVENIIP